MKLFETSSSSSSSSSSNISSSSMHTKCMLGSVSQQVADCSYCVVSCLVIVAAQSDRRLQQPGHQL